MSQIERHECMLYPPLRPPNLVGSKWIIPLGEASETGSPKIGQLSLERHFGVTPSLSDDPILVFFRPVQSLFGVQKPG